MSLIHPAIIEELSRKNVGLAQPVAHDPKILGGVAQREIRSWAKKRSTFLINVFLYFSITGGVAQMVERSLSMREVLGSIPSTSTKLSFDFSFLLFVHFSTFLLLTKMSDCLSIQWPNIMKLNYQMPCLNQTAIFSKIFQFQA